MLEIPLCAIFYLHLGRHRQIFSTAEKIIFTLGLLVLFRSDAHPLLLATFFILDEPFSIQGALSIPASFGFSLTNYLSELYRAGASQRRHILYFAAVVAIFCVLQLIIVISGKKNLSRKMFHFLSLLIYLNPSEFPLLLEPLGIYVSAHVSSTGLVWRYFSAFVKDVEAENDCFALPILWSIFASSRMLLLRKEFIKLLISICIHDSFASFTGSLLKKRKKSRTGMTVGILASCLAERMLLGSVDVLYHVAAGAVEFHCTINDNIAVGVFSILYQRMSRLMLGLSRRVLFPDVTSWCDGTSSNSANKNL